MRIRHGVRRPRRHCWSNLTACLSTITAPVLQGRLALIHTPYATAGSWVGTHRILLDGRTIWDYPAQFENLIPGWNWPSGYPGCTLNWRDHNHVDDTIERLIGRYLDTPRDELLEPVEGDFFHLTDILRAADRRIGFVRMTAWVLTAFDGDPGVQRVLDARFVKSRP